MAHHYSVLDFGAIELRLTLGCKTLIHIAVFKHFNSLCLVIDGMRFCPLLVVTTLDCRLVARPHRPQYNNYNLH